LLPDGGELGFGTKDSQSGLVTCVPVPSGQGVVIRYRRWPSDDRYVYGWPQGDSGYITCVNGQQDIKHLRLTNGSPPILAWSDSDDLYRFGAKLMPRNRSAVYAIDEKWGVTGLRVLKDPHAAGEGEFVIHGQKNPRSLPLECAFLVVYSPYF
ncbi:hypothetical protein HWV62_43367, partial [Athelia sp. TMB]